jgi:D-cysteine desulfhydrase
MTFGATWPMLDRFPALACVPRLVLRSAPTPVASIESIAPGLWIKRDDLTASPLGGNKIRSLEFLLGSVDRESSVATVGARGSTHALATAIHAGPISRSVRVGTWPQEMNPSATMVARSLAEQARVIAFSNPALAIAWSWWRGLRGDAVIPPGGTSPLGILGHVNAAFELADQVRSKQLPEPTRVVVPLGTGGTAAGLALGFRLAGLRSDVIGARVVPRVIGRAGRVRRLAHETALLIEQVTGESVPRAILPTIEIVHDVYAGGYGRSLARAAEIADCAAAIDITVDDTYSAKALVAARDVAARGGETLFWLTFDARWIASGNSRPHV